MRSDECVDQPASGCGDLRLAQALARTRGASGLDERCRVRTRRLHATPDGGDRARRDDARLEVGEHRVGAPLVCGEPRQHGRTESRSDESLHRRRGLRLEHETRLHAVRAQLLFDVLARRRMRDQRQTPELLAVDETRGASSGARPPAAGRRTDPHRAAPRRAGRAAAASRRARCRARRARGRRGARAWTTSRAVRPARRRRAGTTERGARACRGSHRPAALRRPHRRAPRGRPAPRGPARSARRCARAGSHPRASAPVGACRASARSAVCRSAPRARRSGG